MQAMQSQGISHAVQLEQWLMEGAYNKVLEARPQLPDPAYSYFMEKLLSTVRYSSFPHLPSARVHLGRLCPKWATIASFPLTLFCSHTPLWLLQHGSLQRLSVPSYQ